MILENEGCRAKLPEHLQETGTVATSEAVTFFLVDFVILVGPSQHRHARHTLKLRLLISLCAVSGRRSLSHSHSHRPAPGVGSPGGLECQVTFSFDIKRILMTSEMGGATDGSRTTRLLFVN